MEPGSAAQAAAAAGDYGLVIQLCRQERGLSQGELGAGCGYSQSAISRLERRGPAGSYDVRMLSHLAGVLDIPAGLLGLAETTLPVDRRSFITRFGSTLAATVIHLETAAVAASSDEQRQPVLRLLGHAHQSMGDVAFDRLRITEAATHYHSAHEVGVDLGDADMVAAALTQLGDVARRQHRYDTALRLFAFAERHAATASLFTQVVRCQAFARVHAEMGERSGFDHAIGEAEELAGRISPEHHREGDHSPRGVRLERGQGLTLLGDPAAALAIYEESAPPAFRSVRERGSFVIIYAQALAHAGHLDEGVRLAIEGLEMARSYGSPRHVSRVRRMHDRLAASMSPAEPHLVALREALAA